MRSLHSTPIATKSERDAPGFKAIRWSMDWITRPLFGIALAALAIFVLTRNSPVYFALLMALLLIPAAHEWHRMVTRGRPFRLEAAITALTVAVSVLTLAVDGNVVVALLVLALGVVAGVLAALRQGNPPGWEALGVVYLGLPSLALVGLRVFPPPAAPGIPGAYVIIGLFVIVWATDTGALVCGNLIGGPRLAPKLSPAKTWAGTLGGSLIAAAAFAGLVFYFHGAPAPAFVFGLALSATAHAGDLFESFVKRHFGIKNSGALIPGHGGVLDRMDSTLSAGMAMALLVFAFHLNPLFGGHA